MATKYCGKDFIVKLGNAGSPETFTQIAGMRSTSCSINGEIVDVTDKDDQPWRTTLAACGILSMSISLSGHISSATDVATLTQNLIARTLHHFELTSGRGDDFSGSFRIASMERNGEYNGAEQYSMTLESSGTITYSPT
jgi:TP901-1 family phage major tail protein